MSDKGDKIEQGTHAATETDQPTDQPQRDAAALNPEPPKPPTPEEQWQAEQREFFRRQIRVAKGLNWITLVATVVAGAALIFLYKTQIDTGTAADAAKIQAKAALVAAQTSDRQFLDTERPWMGVKVVGPSVIHDDRMGIRLVFANGGHSPANYVWIEWIEFGPEDSDVYKGAIKGCEGKPSHKKIGVLVLPRLDFTRDKSAPVDKKIITYFRQQSGILPMPSPTPTAPPTFYLIGCLDYAWGDNQWYRTRFRYEYRNGLFGQTDWFNTTDSDP